MLNDGAYQTHIRLIVSIHKNNNNKVNNQAREYIYDQEDQGEGKWRLLTGLRLYFLYSKREHGVLRRLTQV